MKSHSASKKRFSLTASGKVKMSHAMRSHRLISKSKKSKNSHRLAKYASSANESNIKRMIPYK
jgi:large subunit ribosomal protein L35